MSTLLTIILFLVGIFILTAIFINSLDKIKSTIEDYDSNNLIIEKRLDKLESTFKPTLESNNNNNPKKIDYIPNNPLPCPFCGSSASFREINAFYFDIKLKCDNPACNAEILNSVSELNVLLNDNDTLTNVQEKQKTMLLNKWNTRN